MTLVADYNPAVSVPFSRMRQLLFEQGGGIQEGVVGIADLKVAQRGAGANMSVDVPAGAAWVQIDTGTRNGLGHVYNDATANVTVTASNATNPRVDQIILRWNDSSIPTGSGNVPTLEVLTGTPTAGAQITNPPGANYRAGAAALPNDCLRLSDVLVPATSTSVTTANIVDRRLWARGVYFRYSRTATDYTTASTTAVEIDTTNMKPRIENSGVPVRVTLQASAENSLVSFALFDMFFNGVTVGAGRRVYFDSAGADRHVQCVWDFIPTAGSNFWSPSFQTSAGTLTLWASTGRTLTYTIEEIVRPVSQNT